MDTHSNPIFQRVVDSVARAQTLPSTCTAEPVRSSKPKVSAITQRIVAEIGFRYRPTAAADLEAHAGAIAALASDVWDVPPGLLERAGQKYARESKFRILPTAYDLITLARQIDEQDRGANKPGVTVDNKSFAQELADRYNANQWPGSDRNEWYVTDFGELKMRPTQAAQRAAIAAQNRHNEAMGSSIRIPMGAEV